MTGLSQDDRRETEKRKRAQQVRILRIVDDLWQARDEIDLDTIDGEFYFRCCLPDCEAKLVKARALASADGFAQLSAVEDLLADFQIPRPIGHAFVFFDHRLRLRHVEAKIHRDKRLRPECVTLDVFSGAWKGCDVAAYMEERRARAIPQDVPTAFDRVGVEFRFHAGDKHAEPFSYFVGDGPEARLVTSERRRPPYVEVIVSVPMPSAGVIATAYDGMLRGQLGWHKKLAQASRQETVTAMRTWTIVLLRKSGSTLSQAVGTWWEHSEFPQNDDEGLSESKYYRDLDRLYALVPDAKHFLDRRDENPAR